jgi:small subunit ribosomal protein S19
MARSIKKGPYVSEKLLKKIKSLKPGEKTVIKTWCRACTITPEMVGFTFGVHNGKDFISVKVTEDMVGHKLGEFSPTTKFSRHGGRMQREIETKVVEKEAVKVKEAENVKEKEKTEKVEKAEKVEKEEETKSALFKHENRQ